MATDGVVTVSLRSITKTYSGQPVVDALDLDIFAGEFFSILGPSGCGKTTTLRMLGGFLVPDGGEIFLAGTNVTEVPPYERDVNTVFQSYALFEHLSVADNVAFGLKRKRVPKKEIVRRVGEKQLPEGEFRPQRQREAVVKQRQVDRLRLVQHAGEVEHGFRQAAEAGFLRLLVRRPRDLLEHQLHQLLQHLGLLPEDVESLVEDFGLFAPFHEDGMQRPVEILTRTQRPGLRRIERVDHMAGADGKARLAQDPREMHDVEGELARWRLGHVKLSTWPRSRL